MQDFGNFQCVEGKKREKEERIRFGRFFYRWVSGRDWYVWVGGVRRVGERCACVVCMCVSVWCCPWYFTGSDMHAGNLACSDSPMFFRPPASNGCGSHLQTSLVTVFQYNHAYYSILIPGLHGLRGLPLGS